MNPHFIEHREIHSLLGSQAEEAGFCLLPAPPEPWAALLCPAALILTLTLRQLPFVH